MISADALPAGPLSYREQAAWNEFGTDRETFFKRGAVLAVDLPPGLDASGVRELVEAVCARHAIFRTAYDTTGGRPLRHVLPSYPHAVAAADDAGEPAPGAHGSCLMPDDLVRIRSAPGPQGGTKLSFGLNEMITDTWSCARLRAEVELLGQGKAHTGSPVLPPLPVGYADYAREERERPLAAVTEAYWRGQLAGLGAAAVPAPDGPDPGGDPAGERILVFPDPLTDAVRTVCQRLRISPFMVVTALVTMAVASLSDERDITVTTMASTRTGKWADVHGNFSNLTLLRTALPANPTFTEALAATRRTVLGALARPVPYLRLAELTDAPLPRPPVRVHYLPSRAHHYSATLDAHPSGAAWTEDADFADWPLDLGFAEDSRRRVAIWASYDAQLFTHAAVERLLDCCRRLLESVATDTDPTSRDLVIGS
jgi:hypothetical protein